MIKFNQRLSLQETIIFFRLLATLIKANIPLLQSCQILLSSQQNLRLKLVIRSLKKEIESGHGLAQGLQKFPHYFNELIYQLIHTGEQTGTLETLLQQITLLLEKSFKIKQQMKQALFYPLIVLVISILVCLLMIVFIVPKFAEFFQNLDGELPMCTLAIIKLSSLIREKYWLSLFPIIGTMMAYQAIQSSLAIKKRINQRLVTLPLLKYFFKKIFILHFARNLAITYAAGITITDALKMIASIYNHPDEIKAVLKIRTSVYSGQQLNIAIGSCSLFPPLVAQMVRIGEESGTLQQMLETIATLYENDIDRIINRMNQLLEPLIMIILGALIGGLIIAMYLPIFKLGMMI